MNSSDSTSDKLFYQRSCFFSELTETQIEIERFMKDWIEDDLKLNFSTLAIVEVLANIFEHAFDSSNAKDSNVQLSIKPNDGTLLVTITDNGIAVPDSALSIMTGKTYNMPDHEVAQDELPESGWGLNLVQHATNSVSYKRANNFNYLELTFDCATAS